MPTIRVDADAIAGLGDGLVELADQLAAQPDRVDADAWALGGGESSRAFAELVGDWRRARLELVRGLHDLGVSAATVGGAYLETEHAVSAGLGAGGDR